MVVRRNGDIPQQGGLWVSGRKRSLSGLGESSSTKKVQVWDNERRKGGIKKRREGLGGGGRLVKLRCDRFKSPGVKTQAGVEGGNGQSETHSVRRRSRIQVSRRGRETKEPRERQCLQRAGREVEKKTNPYWGERTQSA